MEIKQNSDWSKILGEGEHPNGFVGVGVNGVLKASGPGHTREWFNRGQVPYTNEYESNDQGIWGHAEYEIDGKVIKGGPANRSGEG